MLTYRHKSSSFQVQVPELKLFRMFVSSSSGLAVILFLITSSNLGGWLSEVVDVVRGISQARNAFSFRGSPYAADQCPQALCEVPEEYGRLRHVALEYVLADSWWIELVVGISLAAHACTFAWCCWACCCQGRFRQARTGRHIIGFNTPSPARRSLARELL